jgi:hypothetical protein
MFAVGNESATGRATMSEMAPKQRHPPGPPLTFGNMRELGVARLIASCLNDACRHQALIDVSSYPGDTPVPSFAARAKCGKCGGKRVDLRPLGELGTESSERST